MLDNIEKFLKYVDEQFLKRHLSDKICDKLYAIILLNSSKAKHRWLINIDAPKIQKNVLKQMDWNFA